MSPLPTKPIVAPREDGTIDLFIGADYHRLTRERALKLRDDLIAGLSELSLSATPPAITGGPGIPAALADVMAELRTAMAKFPTWPTDPLHALGVVGEEFGELGKAVLQQVYEPHKNGPDDVRKEAVQTAAMALRFLASMGAYEFAAARQHSQASLASIEEAAHG